MSLEVEEDKGKKEGITNISISITPRDLELIDKLGKVFYYRGYINKINRSNIIRYCCHAMAHLIAKEIEEERIGGK
jgi:hypothetical protein